MRSDDKVTVIEPEPCASCGLAAAPASTLCSACAGSSAELALQPAAGWLNALEGVLVFGIVVMTLLSAVLLIFGTLAVPELRVLSEFSSVLQRLEGSP